MGNQPRNSILNTFYCKDANMCHFKLNISTSGAKVSFLCLTDICGYQDTNQTSKQRFNVLWEVIRIKISMQSYPAGFLLQQGHGQLLFQQSAVKVGVAAWFFLGFAQAGRLYFW